MFVLGVVLPCPVVGIAATGTLLLGPCANLRYALAGMPPLGSPLKTVDLPLTLTRGIAGTVRCMADCVA